MTLGLAIQIISRPEPIDKPFEAANDCPWLSSLEAAYGVDLPDPFLTLVACYRWAEFEVGPLAAFSNLGCKASGRR
jgi:hypothetical protein